MEENMRSCLHLTKYSVELILIFARAFFPALRLNDCSVFQNERQYLPIHDIADFSIPQTIMHTIAQKAVTTSRLVQLQMLGPVCGLLIYGNSELK